MKYMWLDLEKLRCNVEVRPWGTFKKWKRRVIWRDLHVSTGYSKKENMRKSRVFALNERYRKENHFKKNLTVWQKWIATVKTVEYVIVESQDKFRFLSQTTFDYIRVRGWYVHS